MQNFVTLLTNLMRTTPHAKTLRKHKQSRGTAAASPSPNLVAGSWMPFGVKKPPPAAPGTVKLFNVDLHLAVIADVKHTLKALYGDRVHITHWSLSAKDGTEFGFEKPAKTVNELVAMQERSGGDSRHQLNG